MSETHIAGPALLWDGRWQRQRCSWCGTVLIDTDLRVTAFHVPQGADPGVYLTNPPAVWQYGALIRMHDGVCSVLAEACDEADVPGDACVRLDPAVTR